MVHNIIQHPEYRTQLGLDGSNVGINKGTITLLSAKARNIYSWIHMIIGTHLLSAVEELKTRAFSISVLFARIL